MENSNFKPKFRDYKHVLIVFLLLIGVSFNSFADFSIEGQYQGKSIYVQNPID